MNSENQQEIQQDYMQLQLLSNQANQMQQHLTLIRSKILELEDLNTNLDSLKTWEKGKEILAPLGANVFVRTELKNSEEVVIGPGAEIMLSKDIQGAKDINKTQIQELKHLFAELELELASLVQEQCRIEDNLKKALKEKPKKIQKS